MKEQEPTQEELDVIQNIINGIEEEPVWKEISQDECILRLLEYRKESLAQRDLVDDRLRSIYGIFDQIRISGGLEGVQISFFVDQGGNISTEMKEKKPMGFVVAGEVLV